MAKPIFYKIGHRLQGFGQPVSIQGREVSLRGFGGSYSVDDLAQEAGLYVFRKFHLYDPHNRSISTWLYASIIGSMLNRGGNFGSVLTITEHAVRKGKKILRTKMTLEDFIEPASKINTTGRDAKKITSAALLYMSLTSQYSEISGIDESQIDYTALETITENTPKSPLDELQMLEKIGLVSVVLKSLPKKEQQVIKMIFGFEGDKEMTMEEIGDSLNISRTNLFRIKNRALEKLRNFLMSKLGTEFL